MITDRRGGQRQLARQFLGIGIVAHQTIQDQKPRLIGKELQKFKKTLEALAESSNAQVQGEAMLFSSQLDSLIEIIPTKVPSK